MNSRPGLFAAAPRFNSAEFGLALAILTVLALTTLIDSNHSYWVDPQLSAENIARDTLKLGIFAMGSAIVIIAGGIDLSSGSMIALAGTVCATLMLLIAPDAVQGTGPMPIWVMTAAIGGTLLTGFCVGSLHAWLITAVGLPPFVATLATLVGLRSLARAIIEKVAEGNTQIQIADPRFRYLGTSSIMPALVCFVLALLAWILMRHTVVGRHIYALGGNEQAARLSGIRTDRLKWLAYVLSSVSASIAGILYVGDQSVAAPQTLGMGYELNAIAAAVVGGCSLQGGVGTIAGTLLGCLFLRSVIDGVSKIIKSGADVYEGLIVGIVVVFAVSLSQLRGGGRRKQFFAGALGTVAIPILAVLTGVLTWLMAGPSAGLVSMAAALVLLAIPKFVEMNRSGKSTSDLIDT